MNTLIFASVRDSLFQPNENFSGNMLNAINIFIHITSSKSRLEYEVNSNLKNELEVNIETVNICSSLLLFEYEKYQKRKELIESFNLFNEYWLNKCSSYWSYSIDSSLICLTLNAIDQYISPDQIEDDDFIHAYTKFLSVISDLNLYI